MGTLEPGVFDASEAPWWEFHSDGCTTVVRQWMGEAAQVIAQELVDRAAGGEASIEQIMMSLDGMVASYQCTGDLNPTHPWFFTVTRGDQTTNPNMEPENVV